MKILSLLLFLFLFTSCSTTEEKIDISSAEKAFNEAKEYEDDERFEESLRRYDEIKSKFPYSNFAKESDLRIAEVYFKREEFTSAALAYANFKFLYPNHSKIPYVSLQLALSYYNQLPPTIDRDLAPGYNAIREFNLVIEKYPNSDYAKTAKEKRADVERMFIEKEKYIADFYFKKEQYASALKRYESLQNMPGSKTIKAHALLRGAVSALELGELGKGKSLLDSLKSNFPQSEEAEDINDIREKYGIR